ncbi:sulfhydryl oxidase 1 isoform X2 [Mustelus asterias]
MAQRWHVVLLSLAAISLWATPGGMSGTGLYSSSDQVTILNRGNFYRTLYNSSNAWLVEFYAAWCGYCIDFAPTWKALANDIKEWKPAVSLAVVNCANPKNADVCRRFEVSKYPTMKFFKAFSKPSSKGKYFDNHGAASNMSSLRHSIIDSLERHGENVWPPACPPLEPISMAEVQNFYASNNVRYLALIVEQENSYLGREVILDMLQYENISVRRVLNSEENLMMKLGVQEIPSCYLYFANNTQRKITVKMPTRASYRYYLQWLPGVTRDAYKLNPVDVTHPTAAHQWRDFNSAKIYMADLESALYYSLNVEVATHQELSGKSLTALSRFIGVLTKYFPGRPFVMKSLQMTNSWLAKVGTTPVSYTDFANVLHNKNGSTRTLFPNKVNWVGCQGSRPQFRGYPCSVWTLFHLLTVQAAKYNRSMAQREEIQTDPQEVLNTLRQYVKHFFGCRECATCFEKMAEKSMDQINSLNEAILWLWSQHNEVNNRLAGAQSEDPRFPKLQWPPSDMCVECHSVVNGAHLWVTDEVLKFLKVHYSPQNMDYSYLEGLQELLKKQNPKERTQQEQQEVGLEEGERDRGIEEAERERRNEQAPVTNEEQRDISIAIQGIRRDASQRRTFIRRRHVRRGEEEDIVDLDLFVNEQYGRQALKENAENRRGSLVNDGVYRLQMHLQSIDDSESLDYAVLQSRLQKRGIGNGHLVAIAEGKRKNWLHLLGMNLSRTDISLCILLYFLSSLCLLSMYLYFKSRFRWRKWKTRFASA